ncbi:uncharacterized protein [Nicotiana tomentosiformis]|uniref:uncharacterized protein n=1 Tax=Nicotiana tomentosiformis TaxID=4098 RepID=UPI00388CBA22
MHIWFTFIINAIQSIGEVIPRNKLVRKILSVLPCSCESKVNAITKAKDLQKLTIDELIGNLKTYEMKKKKDLERREPKKEKKADNSDSSGDGTDIAYLTLPRFQKIVRRNGVIQKKGSSSRNTKGYDYCQKCGKLGHFIKECPLHKQDHYKYNTDKEVKRNPVPDRKFKRRDVADNVLKQALAAYGDSSNESEGDDDQGDTSMMTVESESTEYDSIFALMTGFDEDEYNDDEFDSLNGGDFTCLSAINDDAELWHRRLGHASFSLLNKLIKKDIIRGLPKSKFKDHKVCDVCVKGKQVRYSFKPKKEVSTSSPLDLLHMDMYGPMRMPSRGGKKTKDETFPVCVTFVKQIHVKIGYNVVSIRSDHDTKFENAKCMIRSLLDKTPYELLNGRKPKLTYVRAFRCKCFVLNNGKDAMVHPEHVFKIDKTLYGLKQAPRAWYERLSRFLLVNGFTRGKINNTLFLKKRGRNLLIVKVYVDDIIFGAINDSLCDEFAKLLGSEF